MKKEIRKENNDFTKFSLCIKNPGAGRACAVDGDNPMKLMSIAMRPLSLPPFPLDQIEEMTRRMGGDGSL